MTDCHPRGVLSDGGAFLVGVSLLYAMARCQFGRT